MAHILGIPDINLSDHDKYAAANGRDELERMVKIVTRKPFKHGLYGKEPYTDFVVEECKKNGKEYPHREQK